MNLKKIRKQLEKEKKLIKKELKRFAREDKKVKGDFDTIFPDLGSQQDANAMEVRIYGDTLPVEYNLELRLQAIERALQRIKENRYGICTKCKKPIEPKRLEIIPETEVCIKCKQRRLT
jgi:RNA polymerase-binding transcription factor DksA